MTESLLGIFGGTFDPIHNGHINTVASVRQQCHLSSVCFIPSATPPHRDIPGASPEQRKEMVQLAIQDYPQFTIDDRELHREAPSYTFDTIESLSAENPDQCFGFILGVDAMLGLENWYRWQDLLDRVHFIVMARPGWQVPDELPQWWETRRVASCDELGAYKAGRILEIEVTPYAISATEIRYGIAHNVDVSPMVPAPVWDYICRHNLYHKSELEI